ncbi:MAG TPA: GSCFA domain-containing protein [Candidatus Elarobacter sp.]|nr:GSCFA domain-containing protein [Candidatus Elarobacter sp.]
MLDTLSPYDGVPARQNWNFAVNDVADRAAIDVQGPVKFRFPRTAALASAGSCFANHLSTHFAGSGLRYPVYEPGAEPLAARHGNIYTTLQLRQLLDRALGLFAPVERAWPTPRGRWLDPFRPLVDREGFTTIPALERARDEHLAAVRRMFERTDVFVFTMGLTEVWCDARDGAAFPIPPGRERGIFDPQRHIFRNLDVQANAAELDAFLARLHDVNPTASVVLTVSPVRIALTMEPTHVARASLYSKSVLKVVAEEAARRHRNVDYFASYDAVTLNLGTESMFESDARHVQPWVAERVARLFVERYFETV